MRIFETENAHNVLHCVWIMNLAPVGLPFDSTPPPAPSPVPTPSYPPSVDTKPPLTRPETCLIRFVTHARWPVTSGPSNDNYNVGDNPQLSLVVQSGATAAAAGGAMSSATSKNSPMVWVLLSRCVVCGAVWVRYILDIHMSDR